MLRAEKSDVEPWRFSTPTFLDHDILIREVNYYAADDGSYHVSHGNQVKTLWEVVHGKTGFLASSARPLIIVGLIRWVGAVKLFI